MKLGIEELEQLVKRRDKKIKAQGEEIALLNKKDLPMLSNSANNRLVQRYEMSEKELLAKEVVYLKEIEELKNEISELLFLVSK